jgi:hypothetical protein
LIGGLNPRQRVDYRDENQNGERRDHRGQENDVGRHVGCFLSMKIALRMIAQRVIATIAIIQNDNVASF